MVVTISTAFMVPPKCQSYNSSYKLNILIGLIINMFIVKSKQISCSFAFSLFPTEGFMFRNPQETTRNRMANIAKWEMKLVH